MTPDEYAKGRNELQKDMAMVLERLMTAVIKRAENMGTAAEDVAKLVEAASNLIRALYDVCVL